MNQESFIFGKSVAVFVEWQLLIRLQFFALRFLRDFLNFLHFFPGGQNVFRVAFSISDEVKELLLQRVRQFLVVVRVVEYQVLVEVVFGFGLLALKLNCVVLWFVVVDGEIE